MSLAFVACLERGALESQALLFCRSVRRFGGSFAEVPIHTFEPRAGREPGRETLVRLADLGVTHHAEILNAEHAGYAYGNKILACARAEEILADDVLVFVDTDTLLTGEPAELDLPPGVDFAAQPVTNSRLASTGPGDPNEPYWRRAYELCGVPGEPFVTTLVDRRRVRAYFNSGLVAVRRSAGLFGRWRCDFLTLMRAGHVNGPAGLAGMDEVTLAMTLGRALDRGLVLDARYNYPLQPVERPLLQPPYREAQLAELVHVHYRFWLHLPGFLRRIVPPVDPLCPVARWLEAQLPLLPAIDDAGVAIIRGGGSLHDFPLPEPLPETGP